MKKSKKKILTGVLAAALVMGSAMPALAAEGWRQNDTGWWYEYDDGSYVVNAWKFINNQWYFFDQNGYMSRGWVMDNGTWYFCDANGAMQSGWVRVDGVNYYLNPVSDGTKGAMKVGEVTIDGQVYHFAESGACQDSVATPTAQFYANGQWVVTSTPGGGSSGGGGGSSSGGGGGSSLPTTSTDGREVNQAVKDQVAAVESEITGEGSVITSINTTTSTALETQKVMVNVDKDLAADKTIADTDAEAAVASVMETLIDNKNVVTIEYPARDMTFDMADGGADTAKKALSAAFDRISGEQMSYLEGKTYTAVVTMADDGEVTYTVSFNFQ